MTRDCRCSFCGSCFPLCWEDLQDIFPCSSCPDRDLKNSTQFCLMNDIVSSFPPWGTEGMTGRETVSSKLGVPGQRKRRQKLLRHKKSHFRPPSTLWKNVTANSHYQARRYPNPMRDNKSVVKLPGLIQKWRQTWGTFLSYLRRI